MARVLTRIPGAAGRVESELLHTYSRVDPFDVLILCVRVAVLTAVTLTVPIVLFPVSVPLRAPVGHPVALLISEQREGKPRQQWDGAPGTGRGWEGLTGTDGRAGVGWL